MVPLITVKVYNTNRHYTDRTFWRPKLLKNRLQFQLILLRKYQSKIHILHRCDYHNENKKMQLYFSKFTLRRNVYATF